MARLYGDNEDINSDKVKDFFNDRANKDVESDLSIVLFQDKENSERRNSEENALFLKNIDCSDKKVLEIGCGGGRFSEFIHDKCAYYLGIDYTEEHIETANKNYDYELLRLCSLHRQRKQILY